MYVPRKKVRYKNKRGCGKPQIESGTWLPRGTLVEKVRHRTAAPPKYNPGSAYYISRLNILPYVVLMLTVKTVIMCGEYKWIRSCFTRIKLTRLLYKCTAVVDAICCKNYSTEMGCGVHRNPLKGSPHTKRKKC